MSSGELHADADFEGHWPRECGEHRTTGVRAWCFECMQWCYRGEDGCTGCMRGARSRLAGTTLRWRTGRTVGRTVYLQAGEEPSEDDTLIGMLDTRELADLVVYAVNRLHEA